MPDASTASHIGAWLQSPPVAGHHRADETIAAIGPIWDVHAATSTAR